jgi:hypothetical protein
LIEHLCSRHIRAHRHDDFTPFSAPTKPLSAIPRDDLYTLVLEHLLKNVNSRPKRKKTLVRHLVALSGNTATEAEVLSLIEKLCKAGRLTIDDKDAVTYH